MKFLKDPRLMLVAAMTIFGTIGAFVRHIGLPSGELALYRAVMAMVLLGGYMLITGQRIAFGKMKKQLPLLAVSGVAIGVNWILLFEAYKYTTISVATLSYYFAPVIVMVACPVLFREKLTGKQILCFVMSTAGLVLITGIAGGAQKDLLGIAFGLGAAVFYASAILMNKHIQGVDGIHRTFVQFCAASIVLAPYVLLTDGIHLGTLDCVGWLNLLIVGIFHTGVTYCLYFSAMKELPGQKTAILSYVDPLVAVVISVVVLCEPMTPWQALGGLLILGFTLINELS